MRITITYDITDELEQRLLHITDASNKKGYTLSPEKQFEYIMLTGCFHDIDKKFRFREWQLGLRKDFH